MSKYRTLTDRTLTASALALLLGAALQFCAPPVHATNPIGLIWQGAYPASQSDNNAMNAQGYFCALCHLDSEGKGYNPYGNALRPLIGADSTTDDIIQALRSIEGLNSDGDQGGFSNVAEINASAQPGWKVGDAVPSTVTGLLDPSGTIADIDVVPMSIDFGSVVVGASVTGKEVVISNTGSANLSVTKLALSSAVFSLGNQTPATPFVVAPGASVKVGVVYTPDDAGADSGSLVISSDDPDEAAVTVSLTGIGTITDAECFASVDPSTLVFGQVLVNSTRELPLSLRNSGTGNCVVALSIPTCVDGEFTLRSAASIVVLPGTSSTVTVAYTPKNVGADQCRLDIDTQGNDLTVPMNGEGVTALPTDLDIKNFKVSKVVSLTRGRGIVDIEIQIENVGSGEGPGILTISGVQGGASFVNQVVRVSDRVGQGPTRIVLQPYIPTKAGTITWTASLQDGDPDIDQATATTVVNP